MTSFQSSELTELPVVENSQLFAQRAHSARYAPSYRALIRPSGEDAMGRGPLPREDNGKSTENAGNNTSRCSDKGVVCAH